MAVDLYFKESGEGPAVVLLHGLFGMGSNLGALARSLQDDFHVYSLDLPNHGRSDWLPGMNLSEVAAQVLLWLDTRGLQQAAFVGHSLGGKVAMQLALSWPDRIAALVVADIAPVTYENQHDAVFAALQAVVAADCKSRAEAAEVMARFLDEPGVIQFLLLSLVRGVDGRYGWRFNLDGLRQDYDQLRAAPGPGHYEGPVLFIKGGDSPYILEKHRSSIAARFPNSELKVIPGAGHWLHAEQPRLFNNIVRRFLLRA